VKARRSGHEGAASRLEPRAGRGRAWARAIAAALLLAGLLPAPLVAADTPDKPAAHARAATPGVSRPYDAPILDAQHLTAPEPMVEYSSIEEAGIKLVYHLRARERAHALLARVRALRAELGAQLGREVLPAVEIRVAAVPAQMAALAPAELPAGAAAVAYRDLHLVVTSLGSPLTQEPGDIDERLHHALAHLALDEAVAGHDLPRWLHEGYAVHVSGEDAGQRAEALCVAALRDRLLGLRDVEERFPEGPPGGSVAGAEAAELVRFLMEPEQRPRFTSMIERLREGKPFEAALSAAYDDDLGHVERRFRREMARRYSFAPVLAGATVLWTVVALGVVLRRRKLAAQRAKTEGERRAFDATARLLANDAAGPRLSAEEDELAQAIPPDPEVPKVEHDGRWYTLH
jgi:Peptidase MA superfamily